MRKAKTYLERTKRVLRPEMVRCLSCQTRLKRFATLSQRTIITLQGPIYLTHCGYRCPNPGCPTLSRVYRSAVADGLALPGFTFGLDLVVLVGQLKLGHHQTLDEVHRTLLDRLAPFKLTISRREIMYLFEAYGQLLRASQHCKTDPAFQDWLAQVQENGGLIISIDGVQPDRGNETLYLVRDVLSGRVLNAQNVTNSDTTAIKNLLQPVVGLGLPVIGAISDAQSSELLAIAQLWPTIPHQVCQFHYLKEAARPIFEQDRSVRAVMRKELGKQLRANRPTLERKLNQLKALPLPSEAEQLERTQLEILEDYQLGLQTALNLEGTLPFEYAGLAANTALGQIETSLAALSKKGAW